MSDQITTPPDDDFLNGCDIDFAEHADDEPTQEMRALFPEGPDNSDARVEEWKALFRPDDVAELERRTTAILAEQEDGLRTLGGYSGTGRDTGIAARLRAKGLRVVEVAGWQTRGSSTFNPKLSVDHHTAGPLSGNSPSLGICINGRSDLPGPLCNVFIARDNTVYVVAAGRANHAGLGGFRGFTGNSNAYGIERENNGTTERWREDQRVTAALCHAALLEGIRRDASWVCEHKEWAPTRKIDAWDQTGDDMRNRVAGAMGGIYKPAPAPTPTPTPTGPRTLKLASPMMKGTDVRDWQRFLIGGGWLPKGEDDGIFGKATQSGTIKFQKVMKITADGIVGPATRKAAAALIAWILAQKKEPRFTQKDRIREVQRLVRVADDGIWGPNTERACLRHMISWKKRGSGITNEFACVRWLQHQGNRKFNNKMAEDGKVGPATNHLIVVQLGQRDEICGPAGYKKATV